MLKGIIQWGYNMNSLSTFKIFCISLILASCSNSPTQQNTTNARELMNDPRGTYIRFMNYALPMEANGIVMQKVSAEGTHGVIFPLVGKMNIPANPKPFETQIFNKIFLGIAKEQICNQGMDVFWDDGLYVKMIFRDKESSNQLEIIVDQDLCLTETVDSDNKITSNSQGPFSKVYIQCRAEPLLQEGKYKDNCAPPGIASYHFDDIGEVAINWGGFNDSYYEDGSKAWMQQFEETSFDSATRTFKGSIIFKKKLMDFPNEIRWDFEMKFNSDYSIMSGGSITIMGEDGGISTQLYNYNNEDIGSRADDWWYVRYD